MSEWTVGRGALGDWAPTPPERMRGGWALVGDIALWVLVILFWVVVVGLYTGWIMLKVLVLVTALLLQLLLIPFRW